MPIRLPCSSLASLVAGTILLLLTGCAAVPRALDGAMATSQASGDGKLPAYRPRPGHERPTIAVIGANGGTELSDFAVPYSILSESGAAEVVAVSPQAGPIATYTDLGKPGFRIVAQTTLAEFDAHHPDGADYVVVPALRATPEVLHWLASQAEKGATLVSICNGGMVVARSGVMRGRRATAHWASESQRLEHFAEVRWVKNARYVADGNWISSAGVSAAMPTSIALVEAIAGHDRAAALAQGLGVSDWSAKHDSDVFHPQLGVNTLALAQVTGTNSRLHANESFGLVASAGVDEATLALTLDAFSSTGRSSAYLLGSTDAPIRTRHGLTILPDRVQGAADAPGNVLAAIDAVPPGKALDLALDDIAVRYGRTTAFGVALVFEYPHFKD